MEAGAERGRILRCATWCYVAGVLASIVIALMRDPGMMVLGAFFLPPVFSFPVFLVVLVFFANFRRRILQPDLRGAPYAAVIVFAGYLVVFVAALFVFADGGIWLTLGLAFVPAAVSTILFLSFSR